MSTVCASTPDRYFASLLGQTFPNRRYLLAATSFGQVGEDLPTLITYPPNGTIQDRLDAHGITWRTSYDLASNPTTLLFPPLFFKNPQKHVSNVDFFTDAATGNLPNFCIVDPNYDNQSEENPQNIARGEAFAARVVDAVLASPAWQRTLLVRTYDEHGGYYDHVPRRGRCGPTTSRRRYRPTRCANSSVSMGGSCFAVTRLPVPRPVARRGFRRGLGDGVLRVDIRR